jgi:hypothetical protein
MMFIACSDDTPEGIAGFTNVADITGVPGFATVGLPLRLTGTVVPATANNKTIVWSIYNNGGDVGANISRDTLNATQAGTITVRATIVNGTSAGTADFTKEFPIVVSAEFIAVNDITIDGSHEMSARTPFPIQYTIHPLNASMTNVEWWIEDDGGTGAYFTGNTLHANIGGEVSIRATIKNGIAMNTDFVLEEPIIITVLGAPANEVLLDNFEMRQLDEEGNTGFTNQNALSLRGITNAGTWYAYANSEADVAEDGSGGSTQFGVVESFQTEEGVNILVGPNNSSTEESMLTVLGSGRMIAALDALRASTAATHYENENGEWVQCEDGAEDCGTPGGWYYVTIETPFLIGGTAVDFSNLRSIRLTGTVKGALLMQIAYAPNTEIPQFGWNISSADNNTDRVMNGEEFLVSDMERLNVWSGAPDLAKEDALASAGAFVFTLDTEGGTRADIDISEIVLIFNDADGVPSQFNPQ